MFQAKTPLARPAASQGPGSTAPTPTPTRHATDHLRAFDQLQRWPTRRIRIALLTNAKAGPPAG